jgi:hypothetical protein
VRSVARVTTPVGCGQRRLSYQAPKICGRQAVTEAGAANKAVTVRARDTSEKPGLITRPAAEDPVQARMLTRERTTDCVGQLWRETGVGSVEVAG